jgi:hypothetical protein
MFAPLLQPDAPRRILNMKLLAGSQIKSDLLSNWLGTVAQVTTNLVLELVFKVQRLKKRIINLSLQ